MRRNAVIYCGETTYDLAQRDSALFANIRSAISAWLIRPIWGGKRYKETALKHDGCERALQLRVDGQRFSGINFWRVDEPEQLQGQQGPFRVVIDM